MQYLGKILAISHTELTGVMTEQNVKNLRHRGILQQLRRACPGQEALFAVDSLPERFKQKALTMYPTPEQIMSSSLELVPDGAAFVFFNDYTLPDGRHLPQRSIDELLQNVAVLNALDRKLQMSDDLNAKVGKKAIKRGEFWGRAVQYLDRVPHTLPKNARMLQAKYNDYKRDGYKALISARWCNDNAAKVADKERQSSLVEWLAHQNNLNNEQIAARYNDTARKNGWKTITASTVAVWREKKDLVTTAARLGTKKFYDKKAMQVVRFRPTAPFLMWSLDGWTCELLYQDTKTDGNGHSRTTYTNRLIVEIVLDPCCDYIMGYAIGVQEDSNLIKAAIRNALQHSKELFGTMHRTNQIQSDNFALASMRDTYAAVADKVTPARVGNAKAKPIERFFGYLNKTYCQQCANWSGFGVTTDPDKQPNSEAVNFYKHDFPDLDGVIKQITAMIETDRAKKREEFLSMYQQLPDDRKLMMSQENWLYFFGSTTGSTNRLTGTGLCPKILGAKRQYDCFDITFREHAFEDWTVKYDPDDLDNVLAVNGDGSLRYMLEKKYVQPMALADRKEGDAEQLQRVRDYNIRLRDYVTDSLAEAYENAAPDVRLPQRSQVLGRILITDSRGRHKDAKRQAQLSEIAGEEVVMLKPTGSDPPPDADYDIF